MLLLVILVGLEQWFLAMAVLPPQGTLAMSEDDLGITTWGTECYWHLWIGPGILHIFYNVLGTQRIFQSHSQWC